MSINTLLCIFLDYNKVKMKLMKVTQWIENLTQKVKELFNIKNTTENTTENIAETISEKKLKEKVDEFYKLINKLSKSDFQLTILWSQNESVDLARWTKNKDSLHILKNIKEWYNDYGWGQIMLAIRWYEESSEEVKILKEKFSLIVSEIKRNEQEKICLEQIEEKNNRVFN